MSTLARALRWATKRSTLYQCQLELARFATDGAGRPEVVREWLRASKTLGRYGAFLLGEACFQLKLLEEGTHHHTTFLQLVKEADSGLQAGLRAEVLWVQGRLERADGGG